MATVLITGGTGLVGQALTKELLNKNHDVIILSRDPRKKSNTSRVSYAKWNVEQQMTDNDAISNADFIIHLAGASLAEKRWPIKRKKEIVNSRVKSSELL